MEHVPNPTHMEPFDYINEIPGKDVRGKLIDCFQLWLEVSCDETLSTIRNIIRDLHNASLLIDDIEDSSQLRRGVPVAHNVFGVAPVINCANYVYFLALQKCQALNNPKAMQVFVTEMLNLHRGQANDIYWRDFSICPTEDQYCQMVIDKTGGLFRLSVGLMQVFASKNNTTNFVPLVNMLGLYFQIRDDLINLADQEYFRSKSFCEDLTEGKFSFPIIHCIRKNNKAKKRLLSILRQRTQDIDVKKYAQSLLKDEGSLLYTREKCKELKQLILEHIKLLGGNQTLARLIESLDVQVDGLAKVVIPDSSAFHANIDTM